MADESDWESNENVDEEFPFSHSLTYVDPQAVSESWSRCLLLSRPSETVAASDHTPLHLAAWAGNCARIKELIDGGAEVDRQTAQGWTALHNASRCGHVDCIQMLLDHGGANPDLQCQNWTALHFAAWHDHLCACIVLLSRGAVPSVCDLWGSSPLDVYGEYVLLVPPMSRAEKDHKVSLLLQAAESFKELGKPLRFSLG
jgi:Ankyrin repeats (3 copies)